MHCSAAAVQIMLSRVAEIDISVVRKRWRAGRTGVALTTGLICFHYTPPKRLRFVFSLSFPSIPPSILLSLSVSLLLFISSSLSLISPGSICVSVTGARQMLLTKTKTATPPRAQHHLTLLLLSVGACAHADACTCGLTFTSLYYPPRCSVDVGSRNGSHQNPWRLTAQSEGLCASSPPVSFLTPRSYFEVSPHPSFVLDDVRVVLFLPVLEVVAPPALLLVSLCLPACGRAGRCSPCTSSTQDGCLELRMFAALGLQDSCRE